MNSLRRIIKRGIKTEILGLWSKGRGRILIAVSIGWALSIGFRFVYPALTPFLQSEFQIGLTTTGLLLAVLWGTYAIGHIPGGALGDRIGEGNILVVSTALSCGSVLIVAMAVDVWMLFVGTVTFALATALYGPTRFTILTDIYSKQSGSAVGITLAFGNLGNTVFPAAAVFIATYMSWRLGFGVFFPLFGLAAIALWMVVPDRTSGSTSALDDISKHTFKRIYRVLSRKSILIIFLIQVCLSIIIQGFTSFYPIYLINVKEISPEIAASIFSVFFATGAIIQIISGSIMSRLGAHKTLMFFLTGAVIALWLLPFFHSLLPLIGITVLFSCWNGCGVVTQTYVADTLPADIQGTSFGTLKASWMMIGATSPVVIGVLADYNYFNEAFLLLAGVGTVGVLLTFSLGDI